MVGQVLSKVFLFGGEEMKVVGGTSGFVGGRFFVVV